jgi:hypothetical protein
MKAKILSYFYTMKDPRITPLIYPFLQATATIVKKVHLPLDKRVVDVYICGLKNSN